MVRKGDILYNLVSSETFIFLKTGADTNGAMLQIDVTLPPESAQHLISVHFHPKQQETLRIRSGQLHATINGQNKIYGTGETIIIPAGVLHHWANASSHEELQVIWEIRPAMHIETILETITALSQAGKLTPGASIPFLQLALTLNNFPHHFVLAGSPGWLQRLVFKLLAPVALLLGYSAQLNYKEATTGKKLPVQAQP